MKAACSCDGVGAGGAVVGASGGAFDESGIGGGRFMGAFDRRGVARVPHIIAGRSRDWIKDG